MEGEIGEGEGEGLGGGFVVVFETWVLGLESSSGSDSGSSLG